MEREISITVSYGGKFNTGDYNQENVLYSITSHNKTEDHEIGGDTQAFVAQEVDWMRSFVKGKVLEDSSAVKMHLFNKERQVRLSPEQREIDERMRLESDICRCKSLEELEAGKPLLEKKAKSFKNEKNVIDLKAAYNMKKDELSK